MQLHLVEALGIDKGDIVGVLDIRFRMLKKHELSSAMGFPKDYHFAGNQEQTIKQIGNAIAVEVAHALCREMLQSYVPMQRKKRVGAT